MSDHSEGRGWWLASNGKWYPPESHESFAPDADADADNRSPWWRKWWVMTIAGVFGLLVVVGIFADPGDDSGGEQETEAEPAAAPTGNEIRDLIDDGDKLDDAVGADAIATVSFDGESATAEVVFEIDDFDRLTQALTIGNRSAFGAHRALGADDRIAISRVVVVGPVETASSAMVSEVLLISEVDHDTADFSDEINDSVVDDNKFWSCAALRAHLSPRIYQQLGDKGCVTEDLQTGLAVKADVDLAPFARWRMGIDPTVDEVGTVLADSGGRLSNALGSTSRAEVLVTGGDVVVIYRTSDVDRLTTLLTRSSEAAMSDHAILLQNSMVSSSTIAVVAPIDGEDQPVFVSRFGATLPEPFATLLEETESDNKFLVCNSDAGYLHPAIFAELRDRGCVTGALTEPVEVSGIVYPPPTPQPTVAPTTDSSVGESPADPLDLLRSLTVADLLEAPIPYERDDYDGSGWEDADGDCLNTRHEVLQAESTVEVTIDDCRVVAGRWVGWLSGEILETVDSASIDHLVPLGHAHRAGAWAWSPETKRAFANDLDEPATLNVASPFANQAKADSSPAEWRPQDQAFWCDYATSWIRVKSRWDLAVTDDEIEALDEMLSTCDLASNVAGLAPVVPAPVVIAPPTPTPVPAVPTPGVVAASNPEIIGCDARAEIVTIGNGTAAPISLQGWRLHDLGPNFTFTFSTVSLEPGESVRILTGEEPAPTGTDIVWQTRNIWNNDGDVAHLLDPSGTEIDRRGC